MLRIGERPVGDVMILDLKGTICAGNADSNLGGKMKQVVLKSYRKVLLNLAATTSVDASGISALLGALLEMRDAGGELKLVHLTGRAKELLIVVALYGYFSVFDSEEEALTSFGAEPGVARRLVA